MDLKCDFPKNFCLHRLILRNVIFKMMHVLPCIILKIKKKCGKDTKQLDRSSPNWACTPVESSGNGQSNNNWLHETVGRGYLWVFIGGNCAFYVVKSLENAIICGYLAIILCRLFLLLIISFLQKKNYQVSGQGSQKLYNSSLKL